MRPKTNVLINCAHCGKECDKRGSGQKYCEPCGALIAQQKADERAKRRKHGTAIPKGSLIECARCACSVPFRGGHHRYCDPCQVLVKNERNKELERQKRRIAGVGAIGETRPCRVCGTSFTLTNGQQLYCEPCSSERKREVGRDTNKRYYRRHKERLLEQDRQWRETNPDLARERQERYRMRHPERHKARYKRHYQSKKNDPMFALNYRMRHGIWRSVKEYKKGQPWEGFVDYTVDELRIHLERQFLPGMSWENMGKWHIDHIIPLAHHKFESPEDPEFKAAWSLTNLRPLWAEDNLRKNAKRLVLL